MLDLPARIRLLELATAPVVERFDAPAPLIGPVAVLPSAFNPPTRAHLHLLALSAELLSATPAALLTTRNVAKGLTGASHAQRIEMLLTAKAAVPTLAVLAANQARIVDQAAVLRESYPAASFAFVLGHDTLVRLFEPSYYGDMAAELASFFEHHQLVVTNRAAHSIAEVEAFLSAAAAPFAERITLLEIDDHHASLSSTAARGHAASGGDAPSLTLEVAEYVRAQRLYREAEPYS